jgi:hypothetical protein
MRILRLIGMTLAIILAFSSLTSLSTASAATAADPSRPFFVNGPDDTSLDGVTSGTITWFNRTARVTGSVQKGVFVTTTTAVFEAFAGSTKIESQTRTVNGSFPDGIRGFDFVIGDTNLVGGINRIKITISNQGVNGVSVNFNKPTS